MNELVSVVRPCPYCGSFIELWIDRSVLRQQYTEDCSVCCQPLVVTAVVHDAADQTPDVDLAREGD